MCNYFDISNFATGEQFAKRPKVHQRTEDGNNFTTNEQAQWMRGGVRVD